MGSSVCSIDGCDRTTAARGYCRNHYYRWRRHGQPDVFRPGRRSAAEAFWSTVDKDGPVPEYRPDLGPCWIWQRYINKDQYGVFNFYNPCVLAHRWAYTELAGPIPDGLTIDHLCRVRRCVNPEHMETVTALRNNDRKPPVTHCPAGHEYDEDNTRYTKKGHRVCRECRRVGQAKYLAANREAVNARRNKAS